VLNLTRPTSEDWVEYLLPHQPRSVTGIPD
jgi:hypothetical protein